MEFLLQNVQTLSQAIQSLLSTVEVGSLEARVLSVVKAGYYNFSPYI